MSIKIIQNSMTDPIECVCPYCELVFSYNYEDIQRREENNLFGTAYVRRFVICPVCKCDIDRQKVVVNLENRPQNCPLKEVEV